MPVVYLLFLLSLFVICAILVFCFLIPRSRKKHAGPGEGGSGAKLKVTIPGMEIPGEESDPGTEQDVQESLDHLYASSHNKWICSHCETMNAEDAQRCVVCGAEKAD